METVSEPEYFMSQSVFYKEMHKRKQMKQYFFQTCFLKLLGPNFWT